MRKCLSCFGFVPGKSLGNRQVFESLRLIGIIWSSLLDAFDLQVTPQKLDLSTSKSFNNLNSHREKRGLSQMPYKAYTSIGNPPECFGFVPVNFSSLFASSTFTQKKSKGRGAQSYDRSH